MSFCYWRAEGSAPALTSGTILWACASLKSHPIFWLLWKRTLRIFMPIVRSNLAGKNLRIRARLLSRLPWRSFWALWRFKQPLMQKEPSVMLVVHNAKPVTHWALPKTSWKNANEMLTQCGRVHSLFPLGNLLSKGCDFLLTIGSFLLTVALLCLQLCLGECLLTTGVSCTYNWSLSLTQKNPRVRKIFVRNFLGPEMGAPIVWTPGKMRSLCKKNPCP